MSEAALRQFHAVRAGATSLAFARTGRYQRLATLATGRVVAMGPLNAAHLLVADLDLACLDNVRRDGQVLGHRDWSRAAHLAGTVSRVKLG